VFTYVDDMVQWFVRRWHALRGTRPAAEAATGAAAGTGSGA